MRLCMERFGNRPKSGASRSAPAVLMPRGEGFQPDLIGDSIYFKITYHRNTFVIRQKFLLPIAALEVLVQSERSVPCPIMVITRVKQDQGRSLPLDVFRDLRKNLILFPREFILTRFGNRLWYLISTAERQENRPRGNVRSCAHSVAADKSRESWRKVSG